MSIDIKNYILCNSHKDDNVLSVRGYFTPQEDTPIFSISGLPFKPRSLNISNRELYSNISVKSIISYGQIDGYPGVFVTGKSETDFYVLCIKPDSTAVKWSDDGFEVTIPESLGYHFKAGYTYEYILSGGFN